MGGCVGWVRGKFGEKGGRGGKREGKFCEVRMGEWGLGGGGEQERWEGRGREDGRGL